MEATDDAQNSIIESYLYAAFGSPNPTRQSMKGWDLGRGESSLTRQEFQRAQDPRAEAQVTSTWMRVCLVVL